MLINSTNYFMRNAKLLSCNILMIRIPFLKII